PESKTFGVFLWYQFNTAVLMLCYITFFFASGKFAIARGFAKSSKYKPIFPLSQILKLLVACFT
ncbi:MAG: hypothetical protein V4698_12025, partial [Bacteroidota bacterium]